MWSRTKNCFSSTSHVLNITSSTSHVLNVACPQHRCPQHRMFSMLHVLNIAVLNVFCPQRLLSSTSHRERKRRERTEHLWITSHAKHVCLCIPSSAGCNRSVIEFLYSHDMQNCKGHFEQPATAPPPPRSHLVTKVRRAARRAKKRQELKKKKRFTLQELEANS